MTQTRMALPESREGNPGKKQAGGGAKKRLERDHPGVAILRAIYQGGVDRQRALAILERFGSVRAFEQATLKERMKVPGIGRTLAKRFDYNMELPYRKEEPDA